MTDKDIADLCPELQAIYQQWLSKCHDAGLAVGAIVTWRSGADQDAAKANGLSNANAGQSPHNCCDVSGAPASKAFDFAVFDKAQYIKDGTDPRYKKAGQIGEGLGLVWGGSWATFKDYDHLEMANWKIT